MSRRITPAELDRLDNWFDIYGEDSGDEYKDALFDAAPQLINTIRSLWGELELDRLLILELRRKLPNSLG